MPRHGGQRRPPSPRARPPQRLRILQDAGVVHRLGREDFVRHRHHHDQGGLDHARMAQRLQPPHFLRRQHGPPRHHPRSFQHAAAARHRAQGGGIQSSLRRDRRSGRSDLRGTDSGVFRGAGHRAHRRRHQRRRGRQEAGCRRQAPRRSLRLQAPSPRTLPRHRRRSPPRHCRHGRVPLPPRRPLRPRPDHPPRHRRRFRRRQERRRLLLRNYGRDVQESRRIVLRPVVVPARRVLHLHPGRPEHQQRLRRDHEARPRPFHRSLRIARMSRRRARRIAIRAQPLHARGRERSDHRPEHTDHARGARTESMGDQARSVRRLRAHLLEAARDGSRGRHYARRGGQRRRVLLRRAQSFEGIHRHGHRESRLCRHEVPGPPHRFVRPEIGLGLAELQGCRRAPSRGAAHSPHH
mmetsp:Transcript_59831/g.177312  ORF Transcript_59831/g.177312 Transcript_59831/m.177312 type:complete len:409 (+) Transcript_59831:761-1987(+)